MVSEHELDRFHDVELDGWRRLAAGTRSIWPT